MEVVQLMSLLSLRPLINKLARTPGNDRTEQVVALLTDLFHDAAEPMARALRRANARAWEVVEVTLAGDAFWNGCHVFLAPEQTQGLRREVARAREQTPLAGQEQPEDLRRLCLRELQSARKSGLLTHGEPDLSALAGRLAPLAHYEDPQRLADIEGEAAHLLAGELRRAGLGHLAQFAEGGPRGALPALIAAARHALCVEIEAAPELSRRLVWEAHSDLPAEQQEHPLALLAQTLARHGRGLREWLDEDVSGPRVPNPVHAHASSAEGQPTPQQPPAPSPPPGWQEAPPAAATASTPATAEATSPAAPTEAPTPEEPTSASQRFWTWVLPLLVLGLPVAVVLWLLNHYSVREVRRFVGHEKLVGCVAFSPDGHRAVTGSADETARLWDVDTGEPLHVFAGHTNGVSGVAFSPDGKRLLTGCDSWAFLWDVDSGKLIRRLDTPTNFVLSVAYAPDGRRVLTTSKADKVIRLWDVETGRQVLSLEGHTGAVSSAVFTPDGGKIVSGGEKTVRVWDAATGKELHKFESHRGVVKAVAVSPDGLWAASAGDDRRVLLWSLADPARGPRELLGSGGSVEAVAFAPDGSGVLGGSIGAGDANQERQKQTQVQRRNLRFWSLTTGREAYNFEDCEAPVWSVAISNDGTYILTGGSNGVARLWGLR